MFHAEDHAKGLSTFTIMAGLGGFIGYLLGGIDWDSLKFGKIIIIIINVFRRYFSDNLSPPVSPDKPRLINSQNTPYGDPC